MRNVSDAAIAFTVALVNLIKAHEGRAAPVEMAGALMATAVKLGLTCASDGEVVGLAREMCMKFATLQPPARRALETDADYLRRCVAIAEN